MQSYCGNPAKSLIHETVVYYAYLFNFRFAPFNYVVEMVGLLGKYVVLDLQGKDSIPWGDE